MISTDFYHTGEITANGMTLTNDIKSIADIVDKTEDYAYPYYMGYMDYGDMPSALKYWEYHLVDSTHLTLDETTKRNHGWGFMTTMNYLGMPVPAEIYTNGNGDIAYYPSSYSDGATKYRFINSAAMSAIAYANAVTLNIRGIFVPAADLDDNDSAYGYSDYNTNVYVQFSQNITVGVVPGGDYNENLTDFLAGDSTLTVATRTVNGESVNIKLDINDMQSDSPVFRKQMTLGGTDYVMFLEILGYGFPCYAAYDVNGTTYRVSVVPFFEYDALDGNGEKWYGAGQAAEQNEFLRIVLEYYYRCTIDSVSAYCAYGNYETYYRGDYHIDGNEIYGTLDTNHPEECWWYRTGANNNFPGWGRTGIIRGRHIFTSESNMTGAFRITKYYDPNEILKYYMFFHKVDVLHGSGRYDVVPNKNYTTDYSTALFDSLNKPLNERVQENNGSALFEKLRLWQLPGMDLSIDDFSIDDMPEYDPTPTPGDDGVLDQFSGDNILPFWGSFGDTNGFITHWVMNNDQVTKFGNYVWTNLLDFDNTDPDNPVPLAGVWENLKIATKTYFTTGSVDPASLMELIVGLRYYPFDLKNESSESIDNCIYFGTGKFGVPVRTSGNKTRLLDNMTFDLSSISIVLPSTSSFWYKDFRDYEGSTAFIYLPFCGTYQIPISEIVPNTQFDIQYQVDLATGSCTAYVSVVHVGGTTTGPKTYPVVIANGQCGFEVPLSSTNANRLNATIISDAQKVVGAIAGPVADSANKVISGVTAAATGGADVSVGGVEDLDVGGAAATAIGGPVAGVGSLVGSTALKAGGNLVNVASGMATRSGCSIPLLQGGRGWSALANPVFPYLQIRRGRYMYSKGYEHSEGKPENRQRTISSITGFFQCDNVDMSGVAATTAEVNMIKRMLETGAYHK